MIYQEHTFTDTACAEVWPLTGVKRNIPGIRMRAGKQGFHLAQHGLTLFLKGLRTSQSLSKGKTRRWGLVLTFELDGGGGVQSTGCLPHLALVILSFKGDIQQEDKAQPGGRVVGMGKSVPNGF